MFSRMHTSCKNLYLIKWECFVSNKLDPLPYYYQNINALFKYWKVSLNCTVKNHINRGIHLLLSLDQSDSFANVLGDSYQCCILGRSMHSWDFKDQPRKLKMCICIEETFRVIDTYLVCFFFFVFGYLCNFFVLFSKWDLLISVTTKAKIEHSVVEIVGFTQVLLLFCPYS